jgi:type II secretory pathway pseudopilin PulG
MTTLPIPARRPARRRGVTLIEAVLFISIALGLIVGGIVFFQQASTAQRTNDAVRTISGIASEVRALYQSQNSFAGVSAATLISAGAVPSNIEVDDNELRNEWGARTAVDNGTATTFDVTYTGIPVEACTRLAPFDTSGSGVVGAGISAVVMYQGDSAVTAATGVLVPGTVSSTTLVAAGLTPAAAAAACQAAFDAAPADSMDLTLRFQR